MTDVSRDGPRPFGGVLMLVLVFSVTSVGVSGEISTGESVDERAGRPLAPAQGVWFEEVVTHPHSDWQDDGRVSSIDEHLVLRNFGPGSVNTTGWVLHMLDSTEESLDLTGVLEPGEAFVVMNPPGRINNDVRLRLADAANVTVDEVALGVDGVPEGRGADRLDEAVHLAGPWAGLRAPGTSGRGLGPIWVSHLSAGAVADEAEGFEPGWIAPGNVSVAVRLHQAPGVDLDVPLLRAGGQVHELEPSGDMGDGWWSTMLQSGTVELLELGVEAAGVEAAGVSVRGFPDGSSLSMRVDPDPPGLVPTEAGLVAVADAQGRVKGFPPLEPGPSGVVSVHVVDPSDPSGTLPGCVPLTEPGEDCVVPPETDALSVVILDGAGRLTEQLVPVVVWEAPPHVPEIGFVEGSRPTLAWDPPQRPLRGLRVESAQDVTGAWPVREESLSPNATTFVDEDWVPGEPRAYRLVIEDLAGNRAVGNYSVLAPEHVPVQVHMQTPEIVSSLADKGEAEVVLGFDRELAEPPRLVLRLHEPRPLVLEAMGEPVVSDTAFSYQVVLPERVPEANGTWSLVGGKGIDEAPLMPFVRNVSWDENPPRVEFTGVSDRWVRNVRHVVTVRGADPMDPVPRVELSRIPGHATVSGTESAKRVTLQGEGLFVIEGEVADSSDNVAPFVVRIGLDASPPGVQEVDRPARWSTNDPVRVQVRDEASGVNRTSLQVWARDEAGMREARVLEWDEDVALLVPTNGTRHVQSPFEVYLAVADQAGNAVEGFLKSRLRAAEADRLNGTREPVEVGISDESPRGGQAPTFLGPPWDRQEEAGGQVRSGAKNASNTTLDRSGSSWDRFSWNDATDEPDGGSWGWALLALVGAIGLGTTVHQVHRRRKRLRPDSANSREEPGTQGEEATWPKEPLDDPGSLPGGSKSDEGPGASSLDGCWTGEGERPASELDEPATAPGTAHWGLVHVMEPSVSSSDLGAVAFTMVHEPVVHPPPG